VSQRARGDSSGIRWDHVEPLDGSRTTRSVRVDLEEPESPRISVKQAAIDAGEEPGLSREQRVELGEFRVHDTLRPRGVRVSCERIEPLMRTLGLSGPHARGHCLQ
jgi:hypothetical protein